jgi:hypothetical protein
MKEVRVLTIRRILVLATLLILGTFAVLVPMQPPPAAHAVGTAVLSINATELSTGPPAVYSAAPSQTLTLTGMGYTVSTPCTGSDVVEISSQLLPIGTVILSIDCSGVFTYQLPIAAFASGDYTIATSDIYGDDAGTYISVSGSIVAPNPTIQLFNGAYSSSAGIATSLTVIGSGFAANNLVNVTFNAAIGSNNSIGGVHGAPPTLATPAWTTPGQTAVFPGINGDAIEGGRPPTTGGTGFVVPSPPQPNAIDVLVKTDGGGNLDWSYAEVQTDPGPPVTTICTNVTGGSAALCAGAPAIINLPATAAPGVYTITAQDEAATDRAQTQYTITTNPTFAMNAIPVAPSLDNGVALGGVVAVTIANGAEPPNAVVTFGLDDFLASNMDGAGGFTNGQAGIGPVLTPGPTSSLKVLTCSGSTSLSPGPTFAAGAVPNAPFTAANTGCIAGAGGGLQAQVQLKTDNGAGGSTSIETTDGGGNLLYPDGVYTLVATSTQTQQTVVSPTNATYTTGATTTLFAGVQLDHTVDRISLSSGQSSPGGSLGVRGFGFAANSTVQIIFGAQQAPTTGVSPSFPATPGCAFSLTNATSNGTYTAGAAGTPAGTVANCIVASAVATDAGGSFRTTVSLPDSTIAGMEPGLILAEDFDLPNGTAAGTVIADPPSVHLNASAIAAVDLTNTTTPAAITLTIPSSFLYNGMAPSVASGVLPLSCGPVSLTYSGSSGTTYGPSTAPPTNAGTYTVQAGLGDPSCVIASDGTGALTITPAQLIITANNQSVAYGSGLPVFTAGESGFVNGEGPPSLTTAPVCGSSATGSSPVGMYPITCTGAVNPNYAISYIAGTLTIMPASQTISFAALPNRTVGDSAFALSATGGASGNPVTFTIAGNSPSMVCKSVGRNGATITIVGPGVCTIDANQAGNGNYRAAPQVARSFAVTPALSLTLATTPRSGSTVTSGTRITAHVALTNNTHTTQTIKEILTVTNVRGRTRPKVYSTSALIELRAGETIDQRFGFTISRLFPRGTYTVRLTATDSRGDTVGASTVLFIV